ncbi:MAG TPA: hypothetical protein VFG36_02835, partial [Methanoregula sp.]|nr:hypothetical protein [Methanoregula sp.]
GRAARWNAVASRCPASLIEISAIESPFLNTSHLVFRMHLSFASFKKDYPLRHNAGISFLRRV